MQFVLAPREKMDGWFSLGRVHLIGGSSGAGKTTLMTKVLYRQERGETVFGHQGLRRRSLVLFADRGDLSNRETLLRLRIRPGRPADGLHTGRSARARRGAGDHHPHRSPQLARSGLHRSGRRAGRGRQQAAVRSPVYEGLAARRRALPLRDHPVGRRTERHATGEQHSAQRDRIIGSEKWARCAEDVLTLEFVSGGNGTENERTLTIQHRNERAEKFALEYAHDGSELVEKAIVPGVGDMDQDGREDWMKTARDFNKEAFRRQFNLSGSRATAILDGLRGEGKLRRLKDGKYRWKGGTLDRHAAIGGSGRNVRQRRPGRVVRVRTDAKPDRNFVSENVSERTVRIGV